MEIPQNRYPSKRACRDTVGLYGGRGFPAKGLCSAWDVFKERLKLGPGSGAILGKLA